MPFDPEQFLDLCKELSNSTTLFEEARQRCIISRAYHSAHLFAREVIRRHFPAQLAKSNMERLGDEHKLVTALLTAKGQYPIASKLDGLRLKRAKADYDLNPVWDVDLPKEANNAIALSAYIISQIKGSSLCSSQP